MGGGRTDGVYLSFEVVKILIQRIAVELDARQLVD